MVRLFGFAKKLETIFRGRYLFETLCHIFSPTHEITYIAGYLFIDMLNDKTLILLNRAEHLLILANSAKVSGDIPRDFTEEELLNNVLTEDTKLELK